ncbi:hypothetical protein B4086_5799 [Bacillus cereus]|nr:hypothetical protein B4086_5799 [Bacillus cereus]
MGNLWMERAKKNLYKKSVEQSDFQKAREEWAYEGLEDNQDCIAECELCNHEEIRYEYIIVNRLNNNTMIVGSECIKKFTDDFQEDFYDVHGNLVKESRLLKDKALHLRKILHDALDARMEGSTNTFYQSIVKQIKKDGKLTPNQLKHLNRFYQTLSEKGQQAFKSVVKVSLRKDWEKEQVGKLNAYDRRFVVKFMSSEQRKRYGL